MSNQKSNYNKLEREIESISSSLSYGQFKSKLNEILNDNTLSQEEYVKLVRKLTKLFIKILKDENSIKELTIKFLDNFEHGTQDKKLTSDYLEDYDFQVSMQELANVNNLYL